ncbi:penicillin-binding protein 2 [Verrucomicrobiota bacterium]
MVLNDMHGRDLMRIRIALFMMIGAFVFLITALWKIQIVNAGRYEVSLDKQSIRRVRLPGVRGRILDRNGVCLADNRPSYCIAIFMDEIRQLVKGENTTDKVEKVITELSEVLNIERQVTRKNIATHIRRRLPLQFLAWRDVDETVLARWAESKDFPGVDVHVEPVRVYPQGALAAHILGYVGKAELKQDQEEPYHYYIPEMEGKRGIEAVMNNLLCGVPGGRMIRVDASGFKREKWRKKDPRPGMDIVLTIDSRIQRLAERSIMGKRGAVVVLDPRNGDVLAMASSPSFDANNISTDWRKWSLDKDRPLINRVVSGIYPPGSTFKPIVAITALVNGRATEHTEYSCPGYYDLGGVRFRCWRKSGHGRIAMRKSLEQSCNVYYCQLGLRCGHERIIHMADSIGFGRKTGIDLMSESSGILPNNEWKVQLYNDAWRKGDTCNMSIGQGALSVTPLQMAVLTAALANGGYVYRPRLLLDYHREEGVLMNKLAWPADKLKIVTGGMHDVIQSDRGTGKRARIADVEMAGKTGTAEYGLKTQGKKHAWMIVFAPFKRPRYAVAMVIEDAVSGGSTAAPRIKELMKGIFEEVESNEERVASRE